MFKYFQKSKKEDSAEGHQEEETTQSVQSATDHGRNVTPATSGQQEATQSPTSRPSTSDARPTSSDGQQPVLSDADELFLLHVASEGEPPPLPPRPGSAQASTHVDKTAATAETSSTLEASKDAGNDVNNDIPANTNADTRTWQEKMNEWIKPQQDMALQRLRGLAEARQTASLHRQRSKDRRDAADTLAAAAETIKTRSPTPSPSRASKAEEKEEEQKEAKEVGSILEKLNLGAINNRAVGISHDTQKLLERFNQVLKDIVNGVPTAYDDLEKLLKNNEGQLDKLYGTMPSWLQSLVKTVPVKVYAALAPQLAAAMSAQDEKVSAQDEKDGKGKKKKKRFTIPSVKSLVSQKGMVAGMLRSIISFLEARFPLLLTGTNVIVSMAVFILLFVFWYCHKRGKETRLARDAATADDEESGVEYDSLDDLEKNVEPEKSRDLGDDEPPAEAKMITAGDNKDIEQNVDVLMQQLGAPTEKVTPA